MAQWRHVADANGGFDVSAMDSNDASQRVSSLNAAAKSELCRLGNVALASEAGTYRMSLVKLLELEPHAPVK